MRDLAIATLIIMALGAGIMIAAYRPYGCVRVFGYWIALHHTNAAGCKRGGE